MLSIEDIKKVCEFAEGFDITGFTEKPELRFPDGQWSYLDYTSELFQLIAYPLFLQKVKQGINRQSEFDSHIVETRHYYQVLDWEVMLEEDITDEGLEKAIKYVLDVTRV
ncbi:MAG: hypothetical protein PF569_01395 [Candidatus Woesearchaeota archaeon]|jgi:hypothetical protein|nr:hypothetical protein [Candidatus Woesearchaeota archaeon]